MDIISHGFWAATAYKVTDKIRPDHREKKRKFPFFVFWGIMPDIVSFGLLFSWFALVIVASGFDFSVLPRHTRTIEATEPPALMGFHPIFYLTSVLYSASHSVVLFFVVFGLIFFLIKKTPWTMLGWLLHILIDIPTHSYQFYPTPVFWPLSGWRFYGISWGTPWFLILNYMAIALVYFFFWRKSRKIKIPTP